MTRHIRALAVVCVIAGFASTAHAQTSAPSSETVDASDPSSSARFRVGALRFTPVLLINNLGVDNNVFNTVQDPRQDATAAIGPGTTFWLKTGPALLSGTVGAQYLYFKTYANQRSWNSSDSLKYEWMTGRIRPYVMATYNNTKNRPGYEIDSRIRLRDEALDAGASVRLSGRTSLVLGAGRDYTKFDSASDFSGAGIAESLNRHTDTEHLQFRDRLTPLTTWVLNVDTMQDRFDSGRARNADSVRVNTGFELRPAALISGKILVGFRRLNLLSRDAPDYNGLAASADVTTMFGPNRLHVSQSRDTAFSYSDVTPFYAQTTTGAEFTHRFNRAWDALVRGNFVTLAYHGAVPIGSDHIQQLGAGVGYRVGKILRVGVDADSYKRSTESSLAQPYSGLRAGLSISYGMPQ